MDIRLLTQIAIFITLTTVFYNFLRYIVKLNLPSSTALSVSLSFLSPMIFISESLSGFFVEYMWSIIVLSVLLTIVVTVTGQIDKTRNSTIGTNNRKKWSVVFRVRKN